MTIGAAGAGFGAPDGYFNCVMLRRWHAAMDVALAGLDRLPAQRTDAR